MKQLFYTKTKLFLLPLQIKSFLSLFYASDLEGKIVHIHLKNLQSEKSNLRKKSTFFILQYREPHQRTTPMKILFLL